MTNQYSDPDQISPGSHLDDFGHVSSRWVDRCKPYQVLMTCGHIETRMMRQATAGVPWTADTVLTARAPCAKCDPSKASR